MTANDVIRKIMKKCNISRQALADLMGINKRTLDNKFYRDNFEANDLIKIVEVLGFRIILENDEQKINFDDLG